MAHSNSQVAKSSLESAFELLTTAFQDPLRSNVCATRMGWAAKRIYIGYTRDCTTAEAQIKMAKSHPDFLRASIRFLTSPRSFESFQKMIDRFTKCSCDLPPLRMRLEHPPDPQVLTSGRAVVHPSELVYDAAETGIRTIIITLNELTRNKFRRADNHASGPKPWPLDAEDLLPYGPQDSVLGLENWVQQNFDGTFAGVWAIRLAGVIANYYDPFAQAVFQYGTIPGIPPILARLAQQMMKSLDPDSGDNKHSFVHKRMLKILQTALDWEKVHTDTASEEEWVHWFNTPVEFVANFYQVLRTHCRDEFRDLLTDEAETLSPVFTRISEIIASHSGPGWEEIRAYCSFFELYTTAIVETRASKPKTDVEFAETLNRILEEKLKKQAPATPKTAAAELYTEVTQCRKGACNNISCPPPFDTAHARLCSKCNVMRFCGDKCMKDAWKSDMLPHKAFCNRVSRIKASFPAGEWERACSGKMPKQDFMDLCTAKAVSMDDMDELIYNIRALRTCRAWYKTLYTGEDNDDWKATAKKAIVGMGDTKRVVK